MVVCNQSNRMIGMEQEQKQNGVLEQEQTIQNGIGAKNKMVVWNRSNGMIGMEQEQKQNGVLEQEQTIQN